MTKQQLKFKTTYLLGTLLVDEMFEHKNHNPWPNGQLIEIIDQQRLDVMDSAGWDSKVFLIHRKQLEVFNVFLTDMDRYLWDNIQLLREDLTTRHAVEMVQCLLDLQTLRNKVKVATDYPEMSID